MSQVPVGEVKCSFSVVIATLGGPTLRQTLDCINHSSMQPAEILICIPHAEKDNVLHFSEGNVKVLLIQERGQVAQRAEGFLAASCNLVLQMDDDVVFDPNTIEQMIDHLNSLGPGHVLGPVFCDEVRHEPIARFSVGFKGFLKNIYFTVFAGLPWGVKRMGRYSKSTCAISIDPAYARTPLHEVSWLAGGFVLGFKDELIVHNFYPFTGKAYSEDLLHSQAREKQRVQHVVATQVMVSTKPQNDDDLPPLELKRELDARYRIARLLGAHPVWAKLFLGVEYLKRRLKVKA